MGSIVHLSESLSNQIAAGEVVERPSSVVKELVENAMDAGATRIDVDIGSGGIGWICITDNGKGMDEHDARLSLQRHATSKITTADDLLCLHTFGFRGEALPSIASVSKFELRTRRPQDEAGTQVTMHGSTMQVVPCGIAPGTIVQVRELFYNVPARRKFLKSVATESGAITGVLEALALSAPHIALHLSRDGRAARKWLRVSSREQRALEAKPDDGLRGMMGSRGPLKFEAYLSPPERARTGATALTILINGRVIRDRYLARLISQAYGSVLEPGRYPVGVVYLDVDPSLVDVNVHPQKAEVRFADARAVQDAVFHLMCEGLAGAFGLAPGSRNTQQNWSIARAAMNGIGSIPRNTTGHWGYQPKAETAPPWATSSVTPGALDTPLAHTTERDSHPTNESNETDPWGLTPAIQPDGHDDNSPPAHRGAAKQELLGLIPKGFGASVPDYERASISTHNTEHISPSEHRSYGALRFVAQLRRTFLLCESDNGIVILDQHAAAERVTFHRYRKAYFAKRVASQQLVIPCPVAIDATEEAYIDEGAEHIREAGLDLRVIGPGQGLVTAVPQILSKADPARLARDLLDEMGKTSGRGFSDAVDRALATMACHGSVRAGDELHPEHAQALLSALDEVDFSGHCPHGRPILMNISYEQLERMVGRS